MNDSEFDPFSRLLGEVLAFYRRDQSAFAVDVWWRALRNYSLAAVRAAFTAHARDPEKGSFAPFPADVIRHLEGRTEDRALLAWHRVLRAASSIGHYSSVDFGDAFTHAAIVDLGGWTRLCCTSTDELDFVRRRFCESYRAYVAAGGVPADTPRTLAGEHEAMNAALGYTLVGPELLAADDAPAQLRAAGR
jgi:Domain of unknown function (DUF6475)